MRCPELIGKDEVLAVVCGFGLGVVHRGRRWDHRQPPERADVGLYGGRDFRRSDERAPGSPLETSIASAQTEADVVELESWSLVPFSSTEATDSAAAAQRAVVPHLSTDSQFLVEHLRRKLQV